MADSGTSDHIIIQLNGKDLLSAGRAEHNSRSVQLTKGDYELTFILKSESSWGGFDLKMWNKKNPFKKTVITPAKMVHAE